MKTFNKQNTVKWDKKWIEKKKLDPPPGYQWLEKRRIYGIIKESILPFLEGIGFFQEIFLKTHLSRHQRGKVLVLENKDEAVALKVIRRGGLLGKWGSQWILDPGRVFQDFEGALFLRQNGFVLPEPMGALVYRYGLWSIQVLLSSYWGDFLNLKDFYPLNPKQWDLNKREILEKLALLIRRIHDTGFYHGDLNLMNILIHPESLQMTLIDFDGSRIFSSLTEKERWKNLIRLYRSACKLNYQGKFGKWTQEDTLFFFETYWKGEWTREKIWKEWQKRIRFFWIRKIFW